MSETAVASVLRSWDRLSPLPGGKRLFSWLVGRKVPYTGTISARIEELSPGYSKVRLRDRRRVRNHLDSVHAVALINLGELSTGLALSTALPAEARGIPTNLSIEFLKKARGPITAECRHPAGEGTEQRDEEIAADLTDESGDVVARVTARWRVGPRPA